MTAMGQNEPHRSLRLHGRSTSISGFAGPAVGTSESGHKPTSDVPLSTSAPCPIVRQNDRTQHKSRKLFSMVDPEDSGLEWHQGL
jgi:hypothetical protein